MHRAAPRGPRGRLHSATSFLPQYPERQAIGGLLYWTRNSLMVLAGFGIQDITRRIHKVSSLESFQADG
jgi:hypothetical protein